MKKAKAKKNVKENRGLSSFVNARAAVPDGQSTHACHAQIARRVNVPRFGALAPSGKSKASSRLSASMERGVTADRHET